MSLFQRIRVCKICEDTAPDKPFTFESKGRACCLCEDCHNAIKSLCLEILKEELSKVEVKETPEPIPEETPKEEPPKPKKRGRPPKKATNE